MAACLINLSGKTGTAQPDPNYLQCVPTHKENGMPKGPWIRTAPPEEATGDLKRAYDRIRTTRGRIPDIRAVMAGEPLALEGMAAFFPENNYACSSIDRRLAELIATVTAAGNGTRFGATAHGRQLAKITGDQSFADSIVRDYRSAGFSRKERVLLDYVWKLSKTPGEMTEADIDGLRAEGWTDPQIVATVHVVGFFSYMNRVAEAFGLTPTGGG
jgi:uncharacterized peroxidase-related enzyme